MSLQARMIKSPSFNSMGRSTSRHQSVIIGGITAIKIPSEGCTCLNRLLCVGKPKQSHIKSTTTEKIIQSKTKPNGSAIAAKYRQTLTNSIPITNRVDRLSNRISFCKTNCRKRSPMKKAVKNTENRQIMMGNVKVSLARRNQNKDPQYSQIKASHCLGGCWNKLKAISIYIPLK